MFKNVHAKLPQNLLSTPSDIVSYIMPLSNAQIVFMKCMTCYALRMNRQFCSVWLLWNKQVWAEKYGTLDTVCQLMKLNTIVIRHNQIYLFSIPVHIFNLLRDILTFLACFHKRPAYCQVRWKALGLQIFSNTYGDTANLGLRHDLVHVYAKPWCNLWIRSAYFEIA